MPTQDPNQPQPQQDPSMSAPAGMGPSGMSPQDMQAIQAALQRRGMTGAPGIGGNTSVPPQTPPGAPQGQTGGMPSALPTHVHPAESHAGAVHSEDKKKVEPDTRDMAKALIANLTKYL